MAKYCSNCNKKFGIFETVENFEGKEVCTNCYNELLLYTSICDQCGIDIARHPELNSIEIDGKTICSKCHENNLEKLAEEEKRKKEQQEALLNSIKLTTTEYIEGYFIKDYIGIESVESFIEIDDIDSCSQLKENLYRELKNRAILKNGNALINIKINYINTPFNKLMFTISGTLVSIERKKGLHK